MLIFNKINVQTIAYFGRLKMEADIWVQWINAGGTETKNIKNSLLAMPVLCTCR